MRPCAPHDIIRGIPLARPRARVAAKAQRRAPEPRRGAAGYEVEPVAPRASERVTQEHDAHAAVHGRARALLYWREPGVNGECAREHERLRGAARHERRLGAGREHKREARAAGEHCRRRAGAAAAVHDAVERARVQARAEDEKVVSEAVKP